MPAATNASKQQVPPVGGMRSYAAVVRNDTSEEKVKKKYKLFVKSKNRESPEAVKAYCKGT